LDTTQTTEAELLTRLRAGDDGAYETMFRSHSGEMLSVARKFFGDTDDAADVVQDAFVSAFRAMPAFAGTARLRTWLHRITVNACLLKLRSRRRRPTVSLDAAFGVPALQDVPTTDRTDTIRLVHDAIGRLPTSYQTILRLRELDGLDTAATAERLGKRACAVKTTLHRARRALKEALTSELASAT
jgi:RNA polymerase sigma-70 factor (ECF subfamily)